MVPSLACALQTDTYTAKAQQALLRAVVPNMDFCLPVDLNRLQNERLWLLPIEDCSEQNLEEFMEETCVKAPQLWTYFPFGPYDSVEAYKEWYNKTTRKNPAATIFAIYLKAGKVNKRLPRSNEVETFEVAHGTFAGTTGLINADAIQSKVEIGHVMVLPKFHRTFVNTHASCLLLKHLFDPLEGGDLNMRRVQWQANSSNKPSIAAAERLGLLFEGIMRWHRVLKDNKTDASELNKSRVDGKPEVDRDGRKLGPGRHSAMLAMCWDDWLDGKREHVLELLARP